jgi:cytochrome c-type biogenesis protein CcmE
LRDGTEYFKHVDEVMVDRPAWEGKPLQLHGYVVPGSIMVRPNTLEYKFKVQNNPARSGESGNVVEASYKGVVPDTFKDEAEVVLRGRLTPEGFHTDPNGVIAKCPSKYEQKAALAGT